MSVPVYASLVVAERDGLLPCADIARELGKPRQQVGMWIRRRKNSKFPMRAGTYKRGRRVFDLYNLEEVKTWFANYRPLLGGAPKRAR